jgi:NAD(P)H dehydrogenase (quinone)
MFMCSISAYLVFSFPLSLVCRLTAVTQLAHHGMLYVPLGYTFGSGMLEMNEVKGGSSYGAGTYAADGSRQPTELELEQALYQGKYVAEIAKKLKSQPLSAVVKV